MSETRELEIGRLGAQGDGVADGPQGPIYVRYALPGERVRAEVAGERGRVLQVLRPGPDRATPICRHFGACGGCAAQHMGASLYRSWKEESVRAAFAHRGLAVETAPMLVIPPGTRRRAVLGITRDEQGIRLGFREEGAHTLVDIEVCPVLQPAIAQALPVLRKLAAAALRERGDGRMTVTATPPGLDVALDGETLVAGAKAAAELAGLACGRSIARLMLNGELIALHATPTLAFEGVGVALPAGAFVQAVPEAEAIMTDLVVAAAGRAKHVADLFCGLGTFTFPLARKAKVLAVDGDRAAVAALKEAALRAQGLKAVETKVRDLSREPLSRTELGPFDAVVFDPPRAGAKAQAEALARSKVPVVIAVSCNPATLARDARILVDGGYRIKRVSPIDQFVFSAQVEAVAVFRK